MSLFKKQPEQERKLVAEIENTQFKKQSLIAPLQNDIRTARHEIDEICKAIGIKMYNGYIGGEEANDSMTEFFDAISAHNKLIEEKEAKMKEFINRYDEELVMLNASLRQLRQEYEQPQAAQWQPQPAYAQPKAVFTPKVPSLGPTPALNQATSSEKAFCGECGTPYSVGEDVFCGSCGSKL